MDNKTDRKHYVPDDRESEGRRHLRATVREAVELLNLGIASATAKLDREEAARRTPAAPEHDAPTCGVDGCDGPLAPALADMYAHFVDIPDDHHLATMLRCVSCGTMRTHGWIAVAWAWWSQGAGDQAACDDARAEP